MKKILIIIMVLISLNLFSASKVQPDEERKLDLDFYHTVGNIGLRVSNYGFIGSGDAADSPSCQWPFYNFFDFTEFGSGIEYLYQGALWLGAKKIRRNNLGQKLYWLSGATSEYDVIPDTDPNWTPDLLVVVDTLTTVGFDGDADLYEFLPAYNPLESIPPDNQYSQYNLKDKVLSTKFSRKDFDDDNDGVVDEDDLGRPFNLDDENYCFSIPYDDDGDDQIDEDTSYPGYETSLAYYYDYSPFNSDYGIDRDLGSSSGSNNHIPLNIAIKQETYTWATQYYADMVIFKHTIINADPLDTLYDVTNGIYIDADCGPANWDSAIASDDLSGFYNGDQVKFAYSYDADGDGGLTNGFIGFMMVPPTNVEESCWYWTVGSGPNDGDPLDIFGQYPTANEKYWLLTGRNPRNSSWYTDLSEEDQEQAGDTRFLYSIYGDQLGYDNPTANSINIPPLGEYSMHTVLFFANTLEGLIEQAVRAKEFVQSGFDPSLMEGLPSIPYLISASSQDDTAVLRWNCYTTPDQQFAYYKLKDAPASTWTSIEVPVDQNVTTITGLLENEEYKFKIGVYYGDVYLESKTILFTDYTLPIDLWAGDTNNDGIVDITDINAIGMHFRATGNQRDNASIEWIAQTAPNDWQSYNSSFADCDGNGEVNIADILAIFVNWNRSHVKTGDIITFSDEELQSKRDNFFEIYQALGNSESEIEVKQYLANLFDFPISAPENFVTSLSANYPNPFNPETKIEYNLKNDSFIEISVFNVKGQLVKKLVEESMTGGEHSVLWKGKDLNGKKVNSGIYFYRLISDNEIISTKKMLLIK